MSLYLIWGELELELLGKHTTIISQMKKKMQQEFRKNSKTHSKTSRFRTKLKCLSSGALFIYRPFSPAWIGKEYSVEVKSKSSVFPWLNV